MLRFVARVTSTVVGSLACGAFWLAELDQRVSAAPALKNAIRDGLPAYDPTLREKHLKSRESGAPQTADAAEAHGVKLGSTEPLPASPTGPVVTLPLIIVRPKDNAAAPLPPPLQLPRLVVRPVPGKDVPPEEFETPAARDERLVKKHLSAFDRAFLNRFTLPLFGISKERRARAAEDNERSARRLNEIADLLEVSRSDKPPTKEERELHELYLDAVVSRPK